MENLRLMVFFQALFIQKRRIWTNKDILNQYYTNIFNQLYSNKNIKISQKSNTYDSNQPIIVYNERIETDNPATGKYWALRMFRLGYHWQIS